MSTVYRPLEKEYNKNGYTFKQVKREGNVAMYEQWMVTEDTKEDKFVAYEVFEVIQMEAGFAGPKKIPQPAKEIPPNTESWGLKGFTCTSKELADLRFEQIQQRLLNRAEVAHEQKKSVTLADAAPRKGSKRV